MRVVMLVLGLLAALYALFVAGLLVSGSLGYPDTFDGVLMLILSSAASAVMFRGARRMRLKVRQQIEATVASNRLNEVEFCN